MRAAEFANEEWSEKYKRSIDCSHPKGFSQRAHCQGRKKNEDLSELRIFHPADNPGMVDVYYRPGGLHSNQRRVVAKNIPYKTVELLTKGMVKKFGIEPKDLEIIPVTQPHGERIGEDQLDELTFRGSQCTKDCSGHAAGYEWSKRKGGVDAASWSPSFNKGAALFKNGY